MRLFMVRFRWLNYSGFGLILIGPDWNLRGKMESNPTLKRQDPDLTLRKT